MFHTVTTYFLVVSSQKAQSTRSWLICKKKYFMQWNRYHSRCTTHLFGVALRTWGRRFS